MIHFIYHFIIEYILSVKLMSSQVFPLSADVSLGRYYCNLHRYYAKKKSLLLYPKKDHSDYLSSFITGSNFIEIFSGLCCPIFIRFTELMWIAL